MHSVGAQAASCTSLTSGKAFGLAANARAAKDIKAWHATVHGRAQKGTAYLSGRIPITAVVSETVPTSAALLEHADAVEGKADQFWASSNEALTSGCDAM